MPDRLRLLFASFSRPGFAALPRGTVIAVACLLVLHYAMAVGGKISHCTTSDELVHLTAGTSYWRNHDYRLHPENGILAQRWAALPAWLSGVKFPELAGNDYWRTSDAWVVGHQFFYETGEDHFPRLMAGRAMIALFSVATGLLVFLWSRQLFGNTGGLVSLGFFAFSPTFLAHGALVTSDTMMAFFFLAATGAWWRHLHDPRARWWWLSAATLGLAFVAKYSAALLIPIMVLLALCRARAADPLRLGRWTFTTSAGRFGALALSAAGQALVVAAIIWACYGFRYAAFNPALPPADHFIRPWSLMVTPETTGGRLIQFLADLHALPEAFLYGSAYVLQTTASRSAFLNGEYSSTGWPSFFVWAFILKTTSGLLLALGLAGTTVVLRWCRQGPNWPRLYQAAPLAILFIIYWATSLTSHLNIGHRHLLPIYPVLFIATGLFGAWLASRRPGRIAVIVTLLAAHAAAAVRIAPHHLAFFNVAAGGPDEGWRHLVDSSLDWGQDLPGLKTWLDEHADGQPVYLSYFGTGSPTYYGIHARRLPFVNGFKFPPAYVKLEAGVYCIGATMLQHVYSPIRGEWTLALEAEYQTLRIRAPEFAAFPAEPAGNDPAGETARLARWQAALTRYDQLRFARLCHYLRVRPPDARVGHSIFIYRLDNAEIDGATAGSLAHWLALIERTVNNP